MASSTREKAKSEKRRADARRRDKEHGGDFTPTSYTVPEGMERFRFKEAKKYRLDVVPYLVGKGEFKGMAQWPKVSPNKGGPNPWADTGKEYYERTYYTHTNIGPNPRAHYCCPQANFGKRCPVCEYREKVFAERGKDHSKPFQIKERQLWLLIDRDAKDKGVQIFESNVPMGLGEEVDTFRKGCEDDDVRLDFWTLEEGMTMEVLIKEESFQGRKTWKPKRVDFVSRKNPPVVEGEMPKLDDLLIEKSYEELADLLNATGAGKKDEDSEDSEDGSQDSDADSGSDADSQDSDDLDNGPIAANAKKKGKSDEKKDEPTVFDDEEDEEGSEDSSGESDADASSDADSDAGSEDDSDAGEGSEDSADEAGSQDSEDSGDGDGDGSQDSDDGSVDEPKKPAAKPAKKPAKAPSKPAPKKKK